MNLTIKIFFSILLSGLFFSLGAQVTCVQVSSNTCSQLNGQYVFSPYDSTYYLTDDIYIYRDTGPTAWYFYDDSNDEDDYPFYQDEPYDGTLPTTGWKIYDPCNGGSRDDPGDVVISFVQCQPTSDLCYEATTDCGNLGGIYRPYATYNGAPYFFDDDQNQMYLGNSLWFIDDFDGENPWRNDNVNGFEVPTEGWYIEDDVCRNLPVVSLSETECFPTPIPTLSQWGLIALSMVMLIFGIIGLKQRKVIFGS